MEGIAKPATLADLPALLPLMRAFYAESHLAFSDATERAIADLIADQSLGRAYLLHNDSRVTGYMVLTFGYSLERGGKTALLDELYVVPEARNQGLGKSWLPVAIALATHANCRSIHLEVDHANEKARALYQRAGFIELPRNYLTRML